MLDVSLLFGTGWPGVAFMLVALFLARPLALVFALSGSGLDRREWVAAAWFGPKGFASLLYALLMLHAGIARAHWLLQAPALVIAASVVAHSSTDVLVARVFASSADR
jgi:NhaP-type Na+/H+ or K+/H+ antiporter